MSDSGAILLSALDDQVGLTSALAGAITDGRQPGDSLRPATEELGQSARVHSRLRL